MPVTTPDNPARIAPGERIPASRMVRAGALVIGDVVMRTDRDGLTRLSVIVQRSILDKSVVVYGHDGARHTYISAWVQIADPADPATTHVLASARQRLAALAPR